MAEEPNNTVRAFPQHSPFDEKSFARFMKYVMPEPNSGCWLWAAACYPDGYGNFRIAINGASKTRLAHRLAYMHYVGPIPDGLQLDHLCRNRYCVNPDHLEAVTQQVNILRGEGIAAKRSRQTHCESGHPLSGYNLIVTRTRGRQCRTCINRTKRGYYRRCLDKWPPEKLEAEKEKSRRKSAEFRAKLKAKLLQHP